MKRLNKKFWLNMSTLLCVKCYFPRLPTTSLILIKYAYSVYENNHNSVKPNIVLKIRIKNDKGHEIAKRCQ